MSPVLTTPDVLGQQAGAPVPATRGGAYWLHVLSHTDPRYGGLSAAVPTLACSLAAQGCATSLAAFCVPGEQHHPEALGASGLGFWPTSRKAWWLDHSLRQSFTAAVARTDGLHIHGLWEQSTAVACRTARRLGKPYVLSAHGMLEPWALAAKRRKKQIYAALVERANVTGAACLHALTEAEARQYRDFGARGPIAVIPNAVTVPEDGHAELFLDRFPVVNGRRIVLFLSRLHPKKGVDLLIEAWSAIAREFPDAHLVIAGPDHDGMQAELERQVERLGIGAQVLFTGMLNGRMKWSALEAAEAYVLPSYSEGLSMALLEAMAVGLPVIATHACNMPEITAAGAGWEIEATAEDLKHALIELLRRPEEANVTAGRNGARLIAERYSQERVTRQMAEVYSFLLGGSRPTSLRLLSGGAQ